MQWSDSRYRSVESLYIKLNSNRNGHFLSLQVRCVCCRASSYSPPPTLHPVFGLRTYFFPVVKLSPKEELLKTDLQKEMSRHLKVFCTAIASSEINCGTCIYPCCVLYLFCSTSAFSQFVQYIFGFLWQIFCVWSHHSHHLGSILCISQLHPPAAYIAGLVLFRFYGPMFCCLFVLGSFL